MKKDYFSSPDLVNKNRKLPLKLKTGNRKRLAFKRKSFPQSHRIGYCKGLTVV